MFEFALVKEVDQETEFVVVEVGSVCCGGRYACIGWCSEVMPGKMGREGCRVVACMRRLTS